ncbi:hypothetical protein L3X38_012137 [Prunus dulcis]|uniref:RNase H type-1 domain-containing protein n=1 Tax=Prunus dulcis TaxID=3755 RepID=A0AAD4ZFQ6_PRUDU|nr:hypothetical protein L3X38_012137 [Prunus dulcis]
MHEILPCQANLSLKRVVSNPICFRCHQAPETVLHALWDCPAAREEMAEELYHANHMYYSCPTQEGSNLVVNWERPLAQFFKINVDGALKTDDSVRGLGVVIRDDRGELIAAAAKPVCGMFTPNVTELFAIRFGLQLAMDLGLQHIQLESDAQAAIRDATGRVGAGYDNTIPIPALHPRPYPRTHPRLLGFRESPSPSPSGDYPPYPPRIPDFFA